MNVITGHCGKCGAPYTQPQVWHGIGTPPITPSCACWNYMPMTISTGSSYPIYKEELQPQKSEEQSDSPASPVQQTQSAIASHLMAHSRDNGYGEVIINSGEFYQAIKQLQAGA